MKTKHSCALQRRACKDRLPKQDNKKNFKSVQEVILHTLKRFQNCNAINAIVLIISEEDKQISEVFKIAGFSLMSPLGKVILDIPGYKLYPVNLMYMGFIAVSLILFYIGIIVVVKSVDTVTEKKIAK